MEINIFSGNFPQFYLLTGSKYSSSGISSWIVNMQHKEGREEQWTALWLALPLQRIMKHNNKMLFRLFGSWKAKNKIQNRTKCFLAPSVFGIIFSYCDFCCDIDSYPVKKNLFLTLFHFWTVWDKQLLLKQK